MKQSILLLAMLLLPVAGFAQNGKTTGTLTWSVSGFILSISGDGAMPDYDGTNKAPWYDRSQGIKAIRIGAGVTQIGTLAFAQCTALSDVTVAGEAAPSLPGNAFDGVTLSRVILSVPQGKKEIYKAADGWKEFVAIGEFSPQLVISSGVLDFTAAGGDKTFTIVANVDYALANADNEWVAVRATTPGDREITPVRTIFESYPWMVAPPGAAYVSDIFGTYTVSEINVSVSPNNSAAREVSFTIRGTDGLTQTVAIMQAAGGSDGVENIEPTERFGVRYENGVLYVYSPAAERVAVYSAAGQQLYRTQKAAGEVTLLLPRLSSGVLIVKGDSGWAKKIAIF
ncbi:MAG: hypothetical protein LBS05_02750 [Tannerellaceae bacterium]|jgi:hypothetical protein|nr:hypothetical protein [Tannerellaceae bacterium]